MAPSHQKRGTTSLPLVLLCLCVGFFFHYHFTIFKYLSYLHFALVTQFFCTISDNLKNRVVIDVIVCIVLISVL